MSKLSHSNDEAMAKIEASERNADEFPTVLEHFRAKVAKINMDGPRPLGKSADWLRGQDVGLSQGLKIADSILAEIVKKQS